MIFSMAEVKDDKSFSDMASLIADHRYDEIDCSLEIYLSHLKNYLSLFNGEFFRAWVAYLSSPTDDLPIGYISGMYSKEPRDEIAIHDHYIKPENRGIWQDKRLIENIVKWAEDKNVKRISWTSDHNAKLWKRIIKGLTDKEVSFKELYFVSCEVA